MNTQAVSDWKSEIRRLRATLLSHLLLAATVGGLVALVLTYVTLPEGMRVRERWIEIAPFLAGWLIVLVTWSWRSIGYRTRAPILLLLVYFLSVFIFRRGGLPGSGRVWLLLLPALALVLAGPPHGIAAGVISILTYAIFALAFSQKWIVPLVTEDPTALETWVSEGGSFLLMVLSLTLILRSSNRGWLEALAGASAANRQLQAQTRELEETNERLRRQTSQLQTTAEIARAGSSILDPEKLLTGVVNRIREGFRPMGVMTVDFVGLFLLDEAQRFAVLKAATGETGQLSLETGYQLEVNETSTIGWCITHRQARVASPSGSPRSGGREEDAVRSDALPVPRMRSEIALPLRSRGHTLGALSVQSTQEGAFSKADTAALQTLADQVAVAIDNARLFSQTEAVLKEIQAVQRRYLAQAWREFLAMGPVAQIDYTQPGTEPGDGSFLHEARREAMAHGQTTTVDNADSPSPNRDEKASTPQTALVVPLKLRGQVIGTMALQETRHRRPWTAEDIALAETVAEQFTLTVENLRLFEETRRHAARERLIGEITDQMQRATDMEALMRITAEGLNRATGGSRTFVRMGTEAELAGGDGSGHKSQEER